MAKTPKSSALIDTRVIYCGDNLDQLRKLPDGCVISVVKHFTSRNSQRLAQN